MSKQSDLDKNILTDLLSGLNQQKQEYAKQVLRSKNIQTFLADKELVETIKEFLNNDLNVCRTSKKTFMHRNTLLYRIEKAKKILSLDARKFDDAIVLKAILILNEQYWIY